jgi:hypothetical protein
VFCVSQRKRWNDVGGWVDQFVDRGWRVAANAKRLGAAAVTIFYMKSPRQEERSVVGNFIIFRGLCFVHTLFVGNKEILSLLEMIAVV